MFRHLVLALFLGGFGIVFLAGGILMRIGIWKTWFTTERVPVLLPTSIGFGLIPIGLMCLSIVFASMFEPDTRLVLFNCLGSFFLVLSIVLAIWQPWWVKPAWHRWLEEHHGDIIAILKEEARAMGRWKWQRRVATQEGLEQWVAEVRQKRGLN